MSGGCSGCNVNSSIVEPALILQGTNPKTMEKRKNPKGNLETRRTVFLEIGFIIALLMVLAAFNYRSYEPRSTELVLTTVGSEFLELPPITDQKEEIKRPPPPRFLNIVIDDNLTDNIDDIPDITIDPDEPVDWNPPDDTGDDEQLPDDIPVRFSSDKAEFPGGLSAMYQYLKDNLNYPEAAKQAGVTGTVYIDFVIEKDGRVSNVVVLRGIGFGCDEEAVRVIQSMPPWKPARQNGRKVRLAMVIPVKFTLR